MTHGHVDDCVAEARQLMLRRPTRELVPSLLGVSGRWHTHDYPSVYCRWNHHPEYEIHLIEHSTGRFIVGDKIDRFGPGQLVMVGPDLPHHWVSDVNPGTHLADRDVVFQFHPDWIHDATRTLPELAAVAPLLARSARGIEFTGVAAARGARELRAIGSSAGVGRLAHIVTLLGALADAPPSQYRQLASRAITADTDETAADVVETALKAMIEQVDRKVTLGAIAARVRMSESAFSRYFHRATGQSFSDTLRRLRLARACQLLENTDNPVTQIVSASGYRNISNFNRQFRQEFGTTPSAYRRDQAAATPPDSWASC